MKQGERELNCSSSRLKAQLKESDDPILTLELLHCESLDLINSQWWYLAAVTE